MWRSHNADNEFDLKNSDKKQRIHEKPPKIERKQETGSRDLNMREYNYDRRYIKRDYTYVWG